MDIRFVRKSGKKSSFFLKHVARKDFKFCCSIPWEYRANST